MYIDKVPLTSRILINKKINYYTTLDFFPIYSYTKMDFQLYHFRPKVTLRLTSFIYESLGKVNIVSIEKIYKSCDENVEIPYYIDEQIKTIEYIKIFYQSKNSNAIK